MITTLILSVLIGLVLGLLGGGGSILSVPILVYQAGLDPKDGIATSLFVVGASSLAAVAVHARAGRVAWRVGALFGATSMLGAYAGGSVMHLLPARGLLAAFTAMMFLTALAMMRRRREASPQMPDLRGWTLVRLGAIGVLVGAVTGMIGAGGGFVIVPALALLAGLPMRNAIATSLLVIVMSSFAGFAGSLEHTTIPWSLALAVAGASMAGSLIGANAAGRIKPESLRKWFAWFVFAMAVFTTLKQLPASVTSRLLPSEPSPMIRR